MGCPFTKNCTVVIAVEAEALAVIVCVAPTGKTEPAEGPVTLTAGTPGEGSITVTFTIELVTWLPSLSVARAVIANEPKLIGVHDTL